MLSSGPSQERPKLTPHKGATAKMWSMIVNKQMRVTDTTKHSLETVRGALADCAVVDEWFGVWRTYVEYASLRQRPSCFTVAGGRPTVAAPILRQCVL